MTAGTDKELFDRIEHTIMFLRMAAVEMRRIAEIGAWSPADAAQLRHIADQCESDASELAEATARGDPAR